jgi:hypothetical protein
MVREAGLDLDWVVFAREQHLQIVLMAEVQAVVLGLLSSSRYFEG